jgi:hypothetical protein
MKTTDSGVSWHWADAGMYITPVVQSITGQSPVLVASAKYNDEAFVYLSLDGGTVWGRSFSGGLSSVQNIKDITFGDGHLSSTNVSTVYVGTDKGIFKAGLIIPNENIQIDTSWGGSDPIFLTQDITIQSGATLTIDPGTQIYFAPSFDNNHSGADQSRCELIVNGTLVANAMGGDPITFKPWTDELAPDSAEW